MAKILSHPRVYAFLHVPVQSGSDSVLSDMKREYCRADFERVVDFLQLRYKSLQTYSTDSSFVDLSYSIIALLSLSLELWEQNIILFRLIGYYKILNSR